MLACTFYHNTGRLRMRVFLKWLGIVLGALLGLLVIVLGVLYFKGSAMLNRTYTITPENIAIPTDAASIERGRHFVKTICTDCHGADLAGRNSSGCALRRRLLREPDAGKRGGRFGVHRCGLDTSASAWCG